MLSYGQKRRREDTSQPVASRVTRSFTGVERLILQEAASILDVKIQDLPLGQRAARLISDIDACNSAVNFDDPGDLYAHPAFDDSHFGSTLPSWRAREIDWCRRAAYQPQPNLIGLSLNLDTSQDLDTLPFDVLPSTNKNGCDLTGFLSPQTDASEAAALNESYLPPSLVDPLFAPGVELSATPRQLDYEVVRIPSEGSLSDVSPVTPAANSFLSHVSADLDFSYSQQFGNDINLSFENLNSIDHFAKDVPQLPEGFEWQLLSSVPPVQPGIQVAGTLGAQSQTQESQIDYIVTQEGTQDFSAHQSYHPDSLGESDSGQTFLTGGPNELPPSNLAVPLIEDSIEQQLVSRVLISDIASNIALDKPQDRRQELPSYNATGLFDVPSEAAANDTIFLTKSSGNEPNELDEPRRPRVRRPFRDLQKRKETGETRKTGACVRCRMQRIRCSPGPFTESGTCITCAKVSGPLLCKLPCVRYKIRDSRLFDKGQHPQFRWSQRWSSWDMVEIDTWASTDIKTILITQDVLGGSTYPIRCRKFIPVEGDSLARKWKKNGAPIQYERAPYAILSMKETGNEIRRFVANNVGKSIKYYIIESKDKLLSSTYAMAYSMVFRPRDFPENKEAELMLQEVFQLWVAIRMESQSERIVGEETLGMEPQIYDPDVTSYGTNSIPPIMSAQIELMTTTRILQPLRKTVLKRLQNLMQANDLRCWFSVYLCLFILLHSCSILTADENRQARKYGLETRYLFDTFIEEMHIGAKTMIYYFHYCNKGSRPFARNWASKENLALAELNLEQAQFLEESSVLIKERQPEFERIRANKDFENDWYFISQLYDVDWKPQFTV